MLWDLNPIIIEQIRHEASKIFPLEHQPSHHPKPELSLQYFLKVQQQMFSYLLKYFDQGHIVIFDYSDVQNPNQSSN